MCVYARQRGDHKKLLNREPKRVSNLLHSECLCDYTCVCARATYTSGKEDGGLQEGQVEGKGVGGWGGVCASKYDDIGVLEYAKNIMVL
jgi:hypothetical protein